MNIPNKHTSSPCDKCSKKKKRCVHNATEYKPRTPPGTACSWCKQHKMKCLGNPCQQCTSRNLTCETQTLPDAGLGDHDNRAQIADRPGQSFDKSPADKSLADLVNDSNKLYEFLSQDPNADGRRRRKSRSSSRSSHSGSMRSSSHVSVASSATSIYDESDFTIPGTESDFIAEDLDVLLENKSDGSKREAKRRRSIPNISHGIETATLPVDNYAQTTLGDFDENIFQQTHAQFRMLNPYSTSNNFESHEAGKVAVAAGHPTTTLYHSTPPAQKSPASVFINRFATTFHLQQQQPEGNTSQTRCTQCNRTEVNWFRNKRNQKICSACNLNAKPSAGNFISRFKRKLRDGSPEVATNQKPANFRATAVIQNTVSSVPIVALQSQLPYLSPLAIHPLLYYQPQQYQVSMMQNQLLDREESPIRSVLPLMNRKEKEIFLAVLNRDREIVQEELAMPFTQLDNVEHTTETTADGLDKELIPGAAEPINWFSGLISSVADSMSSNRLSREYK